MGTCAPTVGREDGACGELLQRARCGKHLCGSTCHFCILCSRASTTSVATRKYAWAPDDLKS